MIKFEGWYGTFYDSYFGDLDKGEWIKISFIKYIYLKINGYRVRIRFN
jgi:hypothetical protein